MTRQTRVTAADLARLVGVGRAAVSNWRKRYESFPAPVAGTAASPLFDLDEVERWMTDNGKAIAMPGEQRFWHDMLAAVPDPAEAITQVAEHLSGVRPLRDDKLRAELETLAARPRPDNAEVMMRELWWMFADTPARRATGTPELLAALMADLAQVSGGAVLDPACGNGQLLRAAADARAATVYGQDVDELTVRLATAWLTLEKVPGEIRGGDSLRADAFPGVPVDAVLGHLPFGQTNWGQEALGYDQRWEFGVPPRTEPELAWVQHAYAHLKPGGWAVLIMPPSAAARRAGRRIRTELLRKGALRAVVSLPQSVIPSYAVALHLWVLQRPPGLPAPTVLLADGRTLTTDDPAEFMNALDRIRAAVGRFVESGESIEPSFAYVVPAIDLLDDEVDLSPARHTPADQQNVDFGQELLTVRKLLEAKTRELGKSVPTLPAVVSDAAPLPTITVADLARTGALEILGPLRGDGDVAAEAPVLTAEDVLRDQPASGSEERLNQRIPLQEGDVVVPVVARHLAAAVITDPGRAVLGRNLYVLRPNPEVLNSWFLAAHLRTVSNERHASSLSGTLRLDVRKTQVPRIPLDEQRRHAEAFEQLHQLNRMARQVTDLSAEMTRLTVEGLAFGKLRPTEKN
ncbi:N-6 DNA methylase [Paractinoplanes lichenicola]|uniref:N-6 DNA methylase n=1 Tax=Paractinoplanes lichenicola TaxID=2802976 RepID=UPI0027DE0876|nr:N-6 DNA methylase [Actinoplanes lichenicola]